MAVAILLASVIVYFLVRNELRAQVDRNLARRGGADRARPAVRGAPRVPAEHLRAHRADADLHRLLPARRARRQGLHPRGLRLAHAAAARAPRRCGLPPPGKRGAFYYDAKLAGEDTRVYTLPSTDSTPPVAIQVVGQLSSVDNELERIRLWLLLVAASGIGLAAAAGFLVARATLRPLRDLSETAERVRATQDLSQRIELDGTDELATLAHTFNAMLGSLDEAQQRQRQLVQDASHELRTPLTSLRTNVEVLAHGDRLPPEERAQLIRDVIDQLGEMTELIGELTELARGEEQAEPLEDVRLDLVTEDAIRRTTRNHPEVPIEAELAPWTMVGQPASLERAIANLLDNAAKWSPAGSPVEVTLADGELTVRDHGPGIAEEDLPHVFERFYRATSARSMPGSGLGLAIVQQVAEAHHGSVAVEDAPGGGALVRFRLDGQTSRPDSQRFLTSV